MKIQYNPATSEIFFASDAHFGHRKVIEHDKRPFKDVDEMDAAIIANWNSVVRKQDTVYYLGDLCMGGGLSKVKNYADQLNGKIHFITGNHDDYNIILRTERFESVSYYKEFWIQEDGLPDQFVCMMHYPIQQWNRFYRGSFMLFGHCHGNINHYDNVQKYRMLDVGLNSHNYTPISYAKVKEILNPRKYLYEDTI